MKQEPKIRKRKIKYPGIVKDAELLGISRKQLFCVLEGERPSKSLTRRYHELKARQEEEKGGSK